MSQDLLSWVMDPDAPEPSARSLRDFAELPLPPGLAQGTLNAVSKERALSAPTLPRPMPDSLPSQGESAPTVGPAPSAPAPANRPWWGRSTPPVVGLLAAAVALLVVRVGLPETGDPELLVPRGSELTAPPVHLEMSTQLGGDGPVQRLSKSQKSRAGDRLFFHYQADQPAYIHLLLATPQGVQVLHQAQVDPGQDELRLGGTPIFWQIDAGDPSGVFALISSTQPLSPEQLKAQLEQIPAEPEALCQSARAAGRYCDASKVEVAP